MAGKFWATGSVDLVTFGFLHPHPVVKEEYEFIRFLNFSQPILYPLVFSYFKLVFNGPGDFPYFLVLVGLQFTE
jgi:hypothetical protein